MEYDAITKQKLQTKTSGFKCESAFFLSQFELHQINKLFALYQKMMAVLMRVYEGLPLRIQLRYS